MFAWLDHQQELRLCACVYTCVLGCALGLQGGLQPQSPVVGRRGMGQGWPGEKAHAQSEGVKQE